MTHPDGSDSGGPTSRHPEEKDQTQEVEAVQVQEERRHRDKTITKEVAADTPPQDDKGKSSPIKTQELEALFVDNERSEPTPAGEETAPTGVLFLADQTIRWHEIGYRAGALLAHVDGHRRVDEVIRRSGLDPETGLALISNLLRVGLIRNR